MELSEKQRFWEGRNLEEYVLSACLHNKQALAKAMNNLRSERDFKDDKNREAFAVLEMRYEEGKGIDPIVIIDEWIDVGIYNESQARAIGGAWEGDTDYEPKIEELKKIGGMRKAKNDLRDLWEQSQTNTSPESLAQKAFDMAVKWDNGSHKKYYTAREVEQMEQNQNVGERLPLGIPLFDDVIYQNAGLHKGTMKATIFREKHGKTRSACWEVAQHLRQGRTVLYVTLEGQNKDIKNRVKQILQDEWEDLKDNLLMKDSSVMLGEVKSAVIEACFADDVDVVVVDYLQRMELDTDRYIQENPKFNQCCKQLTDLCVKYDFLLNMLSQVTSEDKHEKGWSNIPEAHDAYGSKEIVRAASIIMVGFRPSWYEELVVKDEMMDTYKVKDPDENHVPFTSVFMKPVLSREKMEHAHRYVHFVDTDTGFKIHRQTLI